MTPSPLDRAAVWPPVAAAQPDPARALRPRSGRAGSGTSKTQAGAAEGRARAPRPGTSGPARAATEGTARAAKTTIARFTVHGEPVSKERPRVARNTAYTPLKTRLAEDAIGWAFRRARPGWGRPDPDGRYGVAVIFATGNQRRRDVDNMLKLCLDALNKLVYADDAQVEEVHARVIRGAPEPGTDITVYRLAETAP